MILSRAAAVLALAAVSLAQNPYPITGAPVASGSYGVPLRKNINDLYSAGGPQWDVYIQAIQRMYNASDSDPLSYFMISGIHGYPYMDWNNTEGPPKGDSWLGHCPHGQHTFCTWHRPFMMLFEQVLVETALQIASLYPARYRQNYTEAAQTLRAPFWDWADVSEVPPATVPETLPINVPSGSGIRKVDLPNPLQGYTFPQAAIDGKYGDFELGVERTTRCPSPNSYPETANSNLASRPYKDWIYDTLTSSTTFVDFASTSGDGISLETVHNAIHWDAACAQQFLAPESSAFDPLFWMHHSQVDRLWAYWQAIRNDQTVFTDTFSAQSLWSVKSGTKISNQSPLAPFYNANGEHYTSYSVTPISSFGYSYEGMEWWEKTPDQMKSDVTAIINNLYGPSSSESSRRRRSQAPPSGASASASASNSSADGQTQRHFVKISVNVEDIPIRPVNVEVYIGGKQAGSMVVMKLPATGPSKNAFSIDKAIEALQASDAAQAGDVLQNIQDYVSIDIKQVDGTLVPPESVKSLEFHVETVLVTPPKSLHELPKFGRRTHHNPFKVVRGAVNCLDDIVSSLAKGKVSRCGLAK